MGLSSIGWTDYTFNPWLGCCQVPEHPGCRFCYAITEQAVVMRKGGRVRWGEVWQGGMRVVVADSTWAHPMTWARKAAREGVRRRVFCASLGDVLEDPQMPTQLPESWSLGRRLLARERFWKIRAEMAAARARLWQLIRDTAVITIPSSFAHGEPRIRSQGGLNWLILTKRIRNWRIIPPDVRRFIWLGTSVSDQTTANEMVPELIGTEGFRHRFLSVEPLISQVDLSAWLPDAEGYFDTPEGMVHKSDAPWLMPSWVIAGGESGPLSRPVSPMWIRLLRAQCVSAGIPFFFKQWGGKNKETAGNELDGRKWEQVPESGLPAMAA